MMLFFLWYITWWPAHTGNIELGLRSLNVYDYPASARRYLIRNYNPTFDWSKSLKRIETSRKTLVGCPNLMTYSLGKLFLKGTKRTWSQRKREFIDTIDTTFSQKKPDKDDEEVNDRDTDIVGWTSPRLLVLYLQNIFSVHPWRHQ